MAAWPRRGDAGGTMIAEYSTSVIGHPSQAEFRLPHFKTVD